MATNGGGWTAFQRRRDGSVDFYRDWEEYRSGFGDLNGEFWLGLDKLHRLATNQTLRVDLADFDNVKRYAQYESFSVGPRSSDYVMYVGKYTGNAGDSSGYPKRDGYKFSTTDDNNCASTFKGAWWYGACHLANLNGQYLKGQHSSYADGVNWQTFKGPNYSLKFTEMKIKPQ